MKMQLLKTALLMTGRKIYEDSITHERKTSDHYID